MPEQNNINIVSYAIEYEIVSDCTNTATFNIDDLQSLYYYLEDILWIENIYVNVTINDEAHMYCFTTKLVDDKWRLQLEDRFVVSNNYVLNHICNIFDQYEFIQDNQKKFSEYLI